jgi:hypothetical protein
VLPGEDPFRGSFLQQRVLLHEERVLVLGIVLKVGVQPVAPPGIEGVEQPGELGGTRTPGPAAQRDTGSSSRACLTPLAPAALVDAVLTALGV